MKKKWILPFIVLMLFTMIASACGNGASSGASDENKGSCN